VNSRWTRVSRSLALGETRDAEVTAGVAFWQFVCTGAEPESRLARAPCSSVGRSVAGTGETVTGCVPAHLRPKVAFGERVTGCVVVHLRPVVGVGEIVTGW